MSFLRHPCLIWYLKCETFSCVHLNIITPTFCRDHHHHVVIQSRRVAYFKDFICATRQHGRTLLEKNFEGIFNFTAHFVRFYRFVWLGTKTFLLFVIVVHCCMKADSGNMFICIPINVKLFDCGDYFKVNG